MSDGARVNSCHYSRTSDLCTAGGAPRLSQNQPAGGTGKDGSCALQLGLDPVSWRAVGFEKVEEQDSSETCVFEQRVVQRPTHGRLSFESSLEPGNFVFLHQQI